MEVIYVRFGSVNRHMKAPRPQQTSLSHTKNQYAQPFYQITQLQRENTEPTRQSQSSWTDTVKMEVATLVLLLENIRTKAELVNKSLSRSKRKARERGSKAFNSAISSFIYFENVVRGPIDSFEKILEVLSQITVCGASIVL